MPYSAILFDMDGTLIHSIPLWERAVEEGLRDHHLALSSGEARLIVTGHTLRDVLLRQGIDTSLITTIYEHIDRRLLPLLKTELTEIEGALLLLTELKHQSIPTAIVTSSHAAAVSAVHEAVSIRDYVSTIVTCDDVANVKPHPEPLLLACKRLGVDPSGCLFVGDQAVDRDAAKNAGMEFVLYRSSSTPSEVTHTNAVTSFEELLRMIG